MKARGLIFQRTLLSIAILTSTGFVLGQFYLYRQATQGLIDKLQAAGSHGMLERQILVEAQQKQFQVAEIALVLSFIVLSALWFWVVFELRHARRRVEEEQVLRQHTSRLASLGEMAGGIAHEINNPLAIIQGKAGLLKKNIVQGSASPQELRDGLTLIERTVDRISKIVKGLKSYAREGSDDPKVGFQLEQLVRDTLELCSGRIASRGISLRIDPIPPDLRLYGKPVQISQVLHNLLSNAIDAVESSDKGERWIKLEVRARQDSVQIAVEDSGEGIPPEVAKKIFLPFFTTKEVGKGTGLGLSIASGIIKDHQGLLYLDRESPCTRFVAVLPRSVT